MTAGCWMVHVVDNSKKLVLGEGAAVEAGDAGILAFD